MSLSRVLYPSLITLPDTNVDRHGNLHFKGEKGLDRSRIERLLHEVPVTSLCGTKLGELLCWIEWGSTDGVMWQCTLPELTALIEKWEMQNSNPILYGIEPEEKPISWQHFWNTFGSMYGCREGWDCPECKKSNVHFRAYCENCHCDRDVPMTVIGLRGVDTYNLVLSGHCGYSVAAAAYFSKNESRIVHKLWTPCQLS